LSLCRLPLQTVVRINDQNAAGRIGGRCETRKSTGKGLKALVLVGCAVQHDVEFNLLLAQQVERLVKIVLADQIRCRLSLVCRFLDQANEMLIVLPIPGKCQIVELR